jgi:pimeloyl-ACP methyl ester carboxylesterase
MPAPRLVDIGGRQLAIACQGAGTPTVVLDAGLSATAETWSAVFPSIARFTRVCAYDRAGLGQSDRGPLPRTSQRIVDDLQLLLRNAGIPGPYVLVGHSLGGLNQRLFASEHPNDVVGLVLVDGLPEDRERLFQAILSPASWTEYQASLRQSPEGAALSISSEESRVAAPLPDIPLLVLTHGRPEWPEALPAAQRDQLERTWQALQMELAYRTRQGILIVAHESGHYIQKDQPDLVVAAVRQAVMAARDRGVE